ncbi:MAG: hypothetical protein NT127_07970 [Sphingobacteriales bacterium]|nr:hypothetical protein [Sphingobacteriales bacterium]
MSINITKEEILQIKLFLITAYKLKSAAAKAHEWEEAAEIRDEEKLMWERFQNVKNEIINQLKNFNPASDNIEDYILLQGLLLEFHSTEFNDDCVGEKSIETIESHFKKYWNLRDQMQQELIGFLNESYVYLRDQMHQFVKEGDKEKGQMILNKLTAISDLIIKNKK